MKFSLLVITLMFVIINISIPSSFKGMSVFSSEASVSLNDFVESDENTNDGEKEDETIEIEEVEKEMYLSALASKFYIESDSYNILYALKVYIPSYVFSIFIPPLA